MMPFVPLLLGLAAAALAVDGLVSRRHPGEGPPPRLVVLGAVLVVTVLFAAGGAWHMLLVLPLACALEWRYPRRSLPLLSREKFRGMAFLVTNIGVVGAAQLLLFGMTVEVRPGTWGMAAAGVPLALQVVAFLLVNDLKNYWLHRLDHSVPLLWRLHRLHHADAEVSALSPRDHLSYGLEKLVTNVLLAHALGVETRAFDVALATWQALVQLNHVNVDLPRTDRPFPWYARILTTPNFHAWHHTVEGGGKTNLADMFPLWDFLFGTAQLPTTPPATWTWGVEPTEWPGGTVAGQLLFPFQSPSTATVQPTPAALEHPGEPS